jgi:WD40 repeat protein
VSSQGRTVNLFDLGQGQKALLEVGEDAYGSEELRPLAFSPDGRLFVAGDPRERRIRVWSRDDLAVQDLEQDDEVTGLAFSPDSRLLACCQESRRLQLRKHIAPDSSWTLIHRENFVRSACFSPDGGTLALGGGSGHVLLFDTATRKVESILVLGVRPSAEVVYIDYLPYGYFGYLVAITGNEEPGGSAEPWQLRTWNLAADREGRSANIPTLSAVDLSPDGRYLAWIVHDNQHSPAEVTFWDLHSWHEAGRVQWDMEETLRDLAFSPDGQTLALGSNGDLIKLVPWRLLLEG